MAPICPIAPEASRARSRAPVSSGSNGPAPRGRITNTALGWKYGLDTKLHRAKQFYAVIALSTMVGISLDFIGINPIRALFWTAVINGLLSPPLLVLLLGEKLDFAQLRFFFGKRRLRRRELVLEIGDCLEQIVAPAAGRFGGERIVEMIGIDDAGALFLGFDLSIEIIMLAHEIGDHPIDIADLPALLFGTETVKAKKRIARTHGHLVNSLTPLKPPAGAGCRNRPSYPFKAFSLRGSSNQLSVEIPGRLWPSWSRNLKAR